MARIDRMPSLQTIAGFKGAIDYYVYRGQPCARAWPVITGHHSTPNEKRNQSAFRYFQKSLKTVNPRVKNLWRGMARPANWRWHEIAYRYWQGRGVGSLYESHPAEYPRLKQFPDFSGRFWFCYDAGYIYKHPFLWLFFATDDTAYTRTIMTSSRAPTTREVVKVERGVPKSCGTTVSGWIAPHWHQLDSGFWTEWPLVTYDYPAEALPEIVNPLDYGQLVSARGYEWPGGGIEPTDYSYSSGPMWQFRNVDIPPAIQDDRYWIRGLDPINPVDWAWDQTHWKRYEVSWRSHMWRYVPDPEIPNLRWDQRNPLEDFPAQPPV